MFIAIDSGEKMATVKLKRNDSFEKAYRKFKRLVEKEGILKDYKKHEFYAKPSVAKKEKRKAAQKRRRKNEMRQNQR